MEYKALYAMQLNPRIGLFSGGRALVQGMAAFKETKGGSWDGLSY
jgi:hypothetical protein